MWSADAGSNVCRDFDGEDSSGQRQILYPPGNRSWKALGGAALRREVQALGAGPGSSGLPSLPPLEQDLLLPGASRWPQPCFLKPEHTRV